MRRKIKKFKKALKNFFKKGEKSPKKKIPARLMVIIAAVFVLIFAVVFWAAIISKTKEKIVQNEPDKKSQIREDVDGINGSKGGTFDNDWLYDSKSVPYEEIFESVIEAEESKYAQLVDKKEKKAFLKELYRKMEWENEPELLTPEEVEKVKAFCWEGEGN